MADAQLADVKIRLLESGVGSPPDGASPSASDAPSPGAVSNFTRTISRFSQRGRQGSSHLVSRRGSGSVSVRAWLGLQALSARTLTSGLAARSQRCRPARWLSAYKWAWVMAVKVRQMARRPP